VQGTTGFDKRDTDRVRQRPFYGPSSVRAMFKLGPGLVEKGFTHKQVADIAELWGTRTVKVLYENCDALLRVLNNNHEAIYELVLEGGYPAIRKSVRDSGAPDELEYDIAAIRGLVMRPATK
jgi:hypothetical protein